MRLLEKTKCEKWDGRVLDGRRTSSLTKFFKLELRSPSLITAQRLGVEQELIGPSCLQHRLEQSWVCGRAVDQAGLFTALERRAEDDSATVLFTGLVGELESVRMAGHVQSDACAAMEAAAEQERKSCICVATAVLMNCCCCRCAASERSPGRAGLDQSG